MSSSYAFHKIREGQGKIAEGSFIMGMDCNIREVIEGGEMDIREYGLEFQVKMCQILATHNVQSNKETTGPCNQERGEENFDRQDRQIQQKSALWRGVDRV